MADKERLSAALKRLLNLKNECHLHMTDDLGISEMSFKQLNYLKHFLGKESQTISQLAEELNLTKPTVTEMVKRFIKSGYLYKESCPNDGRVHYLKLTEKGMKVASINDLSNSYLAERLSVKLNSQDLLTLTEILEKLDV